MSDTIRILIATDNHVGYAERDAVRGDDSWKTFHEIMGLAQKQDVDMVLLGGDLFHDNKPSRKSMYYVMRSLRMNSFGDKPCELELLSDGSQHFDSSIGHANYEDPDINVAIPVFSIHGNHDEPSGEGLYAALDLLEMAGLVNYFGRVPRSDEISVQPLLFQKGNTKMALFGLSNVRDERLHRTFREGKVTFKRPGTQTTDWFNLMVVHQNHHAHTDTSYLPEDQLPDFMDLVIWGHEHACDTIAHKNPSQGFRVLQPGSSVATSLVAGEAQPKHCFILNVTGRQFKLDPIRLKTVRPFVFKELILHQEQEALRIAKKKEHRSELTRYLEKIVHGLIEQAKQEWQETQTESESDEHNQPTEPPLPLIRLRVETTSPDGGATRFDTENPQRFSNRFAGLVANRNDVVQFHARKKASSNRAIAAGMFDDEILAKYESGVIQVKDLVADFLNAQSLSILPTNYFSEAVSDYIKNDDKHAMEMFVNESLANQIKHLVHLHDDEEADEDLQDRLEEDIATYRKQLEEMFKAGKIRKAGAGRYKPKPDNWDSEWDGHWEDQPTALIRDDDEEDDGNEDGTPIPRSVPTRARGRGRVSRAAALAPTTVRGRGRGAAKSGASTSRANKRASNRERSTDDEEDIVMLDDDDNDDGDDNIISDDDSQALFIPESKKRGNATSKGRVPASKPATATRVAPSRTSAASRTRQSTISFSQQNNSDSKATSGRGKASRAVDEDIEDDDDDAFEPIPSIRSRKK